MSILKLAGATTAAGIALTMSAAPSALAAAAAPESPSAETVTSTDTVRIQARDYIKCGKGLGGDKRVNFSYTNGPETTTIYFNNHCKKGKTIYATVVFRGREWSTGGWWTRYKCFNTHGQTHGRKKFGRKNGELVVDIYGKSKHCH